MVISSVRKRAGERSIQFPTADEKSNPETEDVMPLNILARDLSVIAKTYFIDVAVRLSGNAEATRNIFPVSTSINKGLWNGLQKHIQTSSSST
jgi:hypothetical protein